MKTRFPYVIMNSLRFAVCISAVCLGLGAASVRAAGVATVNLAGATFGDGLDVHLNSGTTLLPVAKSYKYSLSGTVHFTGLLALAYPAPVELAVLLDQLQQGSSSLLSGTYFNPGQTLPLRVINKTFAGTVPIPGGQTASVTVKIVGKVTAAGQVRFDITDVDLNIPGFPLDLGKIVFDSGSLVVSAPPLIEFKTSSVKIAENVGVLRVTVKRRINPAGSVSVNYATIPGTATANDYTPVSADLTFAPGETTKTFDLPITNRLGVQGNRIFTLRLSAPTNGAVLGVIRKEVVKITDAP